MSTSEMNAGNTDAFYARLKAQLEESTEWPADYLFKFIVPTEPEKIEQINDIFNDQGAVIKTRKSKNGTYTSISVMVQLENADAVIEKYKEVATVEGVISL